jgi:cell division protein FtsN
VKPAAPAAPAARADSTVFGVGVASYLDKDRAERELARITQLAQLEGRVIPYTDSGSMMFRVVVGSYPTNGAAEHAASELMARYGFSEARPLLVARIKR